MNNNAAQIRSNNLHYIQLPSEIIQNLATASPDALLLYTLRNSHAKRWQICRDHIIKTTALTKERFAKAMKILQGLGLAAMTPGKRRANGTFSGRKWEVFLCPQKPQLTVVQNPPKTPPQKAPTEDRISRPSEKPDNITNNQKTQLIIKKNYINIYKPNTKYPYANDTGQVIGRIAMMRGGYFEIKGGLLGEFLERYGLKSEHAIPLRNEIDGLINWLNTQAHHPRASGEAVIRELDKKAAEYAQQRHQEEKTNFSLREY